MDSRRSPGGSWVGGGKRGLTMGEISKASVAAAAANFPAVRDPAMPERQGLYDPSFEKDSCGVGFIADMKNRKTHAIVAQGLQILHNLDHRGAVGADPKLGDGCGILTQIPHVFYKE